MTGSGAVRSRFGHRILIPTLAAMSSSPPREVFIQGITLSGQTFREMLEANASWASADSGFAEVMAFVKKP